jgi:hypothetical protein
MLLVLSANARFIWLYLKETNKIRISNEAQLEAQIRPAVVVRVGPLQELELINLGKEPALHVRLSVVERGSTGLCDSLCNNRQVVSGRRSALALRSHCPNVPAEFSAQW